MESNFFVVHLTIILVAGLVAGWICKKLKASALIGYLIVGTIIGPGGFDLTGSKVLEDALKTVSSAQHSQIVIVERPRDDANQRATEDEIVFDDETSAAGKAQVGEAQVGGAQVGGAQVGGAQVGGTQNGGAQNGGAQVGGTQNGKSQVGNAANSAQLDRVEGESVDEEEKSIREAIQKDNFAFEATTELGVLFLLFSIGVEFTFDKLASTARFMFLGGALQMGLTILFSLLFNRLTGLTWTAGLVLGCVVSLSSTALVYRSMQDVGQADTKRGQATLGMLIFQDIALVPMLLLLPRLFGGEEDPSKFLFHNPWVDMALKSAFFCALVVCLKLLNAKFLVPKLAALRSNEMVILFAVVVLIGMCAAALLLGLTPALGALAAGVALGENRLTRQIDALVLPFREAFSAIFFISLGMLMDFSYVFSHPLLCVGSLLFAVALKCGCASFALRACGMDWRGSLAFGLSISQVGELAFMLLTLAHAEGAITEAAYQTTLFVSVASLVITPNMVDLSLTKLFGMKPEPVEAGKADDAISSDLLAAINSSGGHAIVVGAGHIGAQLANELAKFGKSLCLVDFNPVNLHPFAQRGIATIAGDGANDDVLRNAGIGRAEMIIVTVPNDELALNVIRSCRQLNPTAIVLSRARYRLNIQPMKRAGAERVFCEENSICDALLKLLDEYFSDSGAKTPLPTSAKPNV